MRPIIIVGAGIGGAVLALRLGRQGYPVLLVEAAASFAPIYKGEYLQPVSIERFETLGLLEAIRAVTVPIERAITGDEEQRPWMEMQMADVYRLEGRNGHHRAIHGTVIEALSVLPNVELRMDERVVAAERRADHWSVQTEQGRYEGGFLVGADGRRSVIRELLGIKASEERYSGVSLAATVDLPEPAEGAMIQWLGPIDGSAYFPLPNRQARLYLSTWVDGLWEEQKVAADGGLAWLQERLIHYYPHLAESVRAIPSVRAFQTIPSFKLMAERWVAEGAALLGDAAHCISPVRGLGMNLAIGDAWALADLLARVLGAGGEPLRGGEPPLLSAATLAAYEAERRPTVAYAQMEADRQRRILLSRNPLMAWARQRALQNTSRTPRAMTRLMAFIAGGGAPLSPLEDLLCNAAFIMPALDRLIPVR